MRSLVLFLAAGMVLSTSVQAQRSDPEYLKYYPWDLRVGGGISIQPTKALIVGNAEYRFDRFFAASALFQAGLGYQTWVAPTFGGRFIAPIVPLERVEVSLQSGIGWIHRSDGGLYFTDFVYEFGPNVDVFILSHWTAGLGYVLNVIGRDSSPFLHSFYASVGYRF